MANPGGGIPSLGDIPKGSSPFPKLDDMLLTIVRSLEPSARESLITYVGTDSRNHVNVSTAPSTRPPSVSTIGAASTLAGLRYSMPQPRVPSIYAETSLLSVARMATSASGLVRSEISPAPSISTPTTRIPGLASFGITKARKYVPVKHYSDAVPSMHCHLCCRSAKNVKVHACAKIKEAVCRKVVCVRCFAENGWVYEDSWICCHCRGVCPKRGQCYTYGRSNMRRRQQTIHKQMNRTIENEQAYKRRFQHPLQLPLPSSMPNDPHSMR